MNVEVLDEARFDIADGVAFYDRQSDGAGDYFYQWIFDDIESLTETAGVHETHLGYHRKTATRHPFLIYYRVPILNGGDTRKIFSRRSARLCIDQARR